MVALTNIWQCACMSTTMHCMIITFFTPPNRAHNLLNQNVLLATLPVLWLGWKTLGSSSWQLNKRRLPRFSQLSLQNSVITSSTQSTQGVAGIYYFFLQDYILGLATRLNGPSIWQLLQTLSETFSRLWTIFATWHH